MLRLSLLSLMVLLFTWETDKLGCDAFAVAPLSTSFRRAIHHHDRCSTTPLSATKRKRRRKDASDGDGGDDDYASPSGELPDFDLAEDAPPSSNDKSTKAASKSSRSSGDAANDITPEMMARSSSSKPARSVDQLIRDRSLESKFVFEDDDAGGDADQNLPDLAIVAKQRKASKSAAKKKTAPVATPAEEEPPNLLEKIPFFVDEKTGKVTALKMLEAGTWLGIYMLLGWEVYINSPLFDRAAPLVPVVY